jgi:hypothetical protein
MVDKSIIKIDVVDLVEDSEIPCLLDQIRPSWQSKNLIERVKKLLYVDPSSACQRLLNAAIHDLKEKIIIAGIDLAKEAATLHKLPPINREEDLENYTTAKVIDLSYRMGLLSRPEWRKVIRCYDIRQDLEHEDDKYEAGIEDCIYIFKTCIESILMKNPVQLLRVTDVKKLVEEASPATPSRALLEDFNGAPPTRQVEILKFLMSYSLDGNQSEIVRQNAFTFLVKISPLMQNQARLDLAKFYQDRVASKKLNSSQVRVAFIMGVLPYLKSSQIEEFYEDFFIKMRKIGWRWTEHERHALILRKLIEIGGLKSCPSQIRKKILKGLVLIYLGEAGGLTRYGHIRNVFYSDSAAPIIEELIGDASEVIKSDLRELQKDNDVSRKCKNKYIARRFESLLDLLKPD